MSENILSLLKNNGANGAATSNVGNFGEKAAANYLRKRGFEIVASNFRIPIGRNRKGVQVTGEIDIIALEGETICFIEVKTRTSDDFASPLAAVDLRKQRQILRTARAYRKTFGLLKSKYRFDVVSVVLNGKKAPKIEFIKNFWDEERFKKKAWQDEFRD